MDLICLKFVACNLEGKFELLYEHFEVQARASTTKAKIKGQNQNWHLLTVRKNIFISQYDPLSSGHP